MRFGTGTKRFDLREDLWRIVGVLAVLLLLNVAFYLLLNLPRLRALGNLQAARDGAVRALRTGTARRDAMRELIKRYDEETVQLEDFYANRLGTQADRMTSIQKEIRSIAAEFRIDPEQIDYSPSEIRGTGMTSFQFTIPLVGGYPNLRQFINRVEKSEHLLIVDEVQLTGAKEGGAMLSLTIKISTCFRSSRASGTERPAAAPV
jgi:Tfp pilus assembly protein PilO